MGYYSRTESKKSVSLPMPFYDILSVEALSASPVAAMKPEVEEVGDLDTAPPLRRSGSKGSFTSASRTIPRMPSFSSLRRPSGSGQHPQHGLVVRTRLKSMELLCASKAEADAWISAFRDAAAAGLLGLPGKDAPHVGDFGRA